MGSWHEDLGFKEYPLDPRSNPNLVGVEEIEKRLTGYISQGNMAMLAGPTGSGKTSMLKRISRSSELKDFQFIYISADGVKHNFDVSDAIQEHKSFLQRLIFAKPKNLVILLDECQLATRTLTESIKSKWNLVYPSGEKCIQSVIICQIDPKIGTNFSGSFSDRLGKRVIRMPRLSREDLKKVLAVRLDNGSRNYTESFSEEALDFLAQNSTGSVRALLEYADAVFLAHAKFDKNPLLDTDYRISKEMVFNALQMIGGPEDKSIHKARKSLKNVKNSKRYTAAIEMFEQFGTLSPVDLAEKLDTTKNNANAIIRQLRSWDIVMESYEEDDLKFYVLAPSVQHALIKE